MRSSDFAWQIASSLSSDPAGASASATAGATASATEGANALAPDVLPVLVGISIVLLLVAMVHAGVALLYRRRSVGQEERLERLAAHWNPELIQFLFGGRTVDEIQRLVAPGEELLFVAVLLRFRRRVSGQELDRIQSLAAPYLPLVARRLRRRSPGVRAQAVQILGELGWRDHVGAIVAALDDPSPVVSIVAARTICDPASVDYLPAVLRRLERFRSWTSTFLASMLASAGTLGAHALREALWNDDLDETSRAIAAEALKELHDFRAVGAAVHALRRGQERDLVVAALRLLGQVGRSENLGDVLERIDDPDFVVRVAAVDAVASLGGKSESERLQNILYHDPSRWVALHAARGLVGSGQLHALRTLARSEHTRAPMGAQVLAEAGRR